MNSATIEFSKYANFDALEDAKTSVSSGLLQPINESRTKSNIDESPENLQKGAEDTYSIESKKLRYTRKESVSMYSVTPGKAHDSFCKSKILFVRLLLFLYNLIVNQSI